MTVWLLIIGFGCIAGEEWVDTTDPDKKGLEKGVLDGFFGSEEFFAISLWTASFFYFYLFLSPEGPNDLSLIRYDRFYFLTREFLPFFLEQWNWFYDWTAPRALPQSQVDWRDWNQNPPGDPRIPFFKVFNHTLVVKFLRFISAL